MQLQKCSEIVLSAIGPNNPTGLKTNIPSDSGAKNGFVQINVA
jgi:hypothetical protein